MPDFPIDIPDSARAVKAHYPTKPDQALVREIRDYIKSTGTPYLWHGHTHTRPPDGSEIVYCGEFDLPPSHFGPMNRDKWAACPCCHPETAWYYKGGRIAWFPDEKVIRNIGGNCFAKINSPGHKAALAAYELEERKRKNRDFLLLKAPLVPGAIKTIERAIEIAKAVDDARRVLSGRLKDRIGFDIWNDIRSDGVLKRRVKRTETIIRPDGTEQEREAFDFVTHAALAGYQMLNPNAGKLADALEKCATTLGKANFGEHPQANIDRLTDDERHKAANSIGKPIADAKAIFAEIEDCRQFLSVLSIATLNAWGRHPDSPASVYLKLDGRTLHIGKVEDETKPMPIGAAFFDSLGSLPEFGSVKDV